VVLKLWAPHNVRGSGENIQICMLNYSLLASHCGPKVLHLPTSLILASLLGGCQASNSSNNYTTHSRPGVWSDLRELELGVVRVHLSDLFSGWSTKDFDDLN